MGPNGIPTGAPTAQLQAFAQSVYLMIKNRYYSDLTTADGQIFLSSVVDWANMFIDELETEINSDGDPIDWIWVRQPGVKLGVANYNSSIVVNGSIPWDSIDYNNLIAGDDRFVQILDQYNNIIGQFIVVAPADMSNDPRRNDEDMCTLVNGTVQFSRPFTPEESGLNIYGDVTTYLPRIQTIISPTTQQIVATNTDIFSTIKPFTLLKLGTTKNAILPDIVMGGLQPSYVQKYNDLLTNAINRSTASAIAPTADYENYENIHGVGF